MPQKHNKTPYILSPLYSKISMVLDHNTGKQCELFFTSTVTEI